MKTHPILPPTESWAHKGEDNFLHMMDWPQGNDPRRMLLKNMSFWDDISCDTIMTHTAITSRIIPNKLQASLADLRNMVANHIEGLDGEDADTGHRNWSKGDVKEQTRAWKLWAALDLLVFGSLKEGENKDKSVKEEISERINNIREGEWHLIWPFIQHRKQPAGDGTEVLAQTAKRVEALVQAGEMGKAAAAVWGPGTSASAEAIRKQFEKSQGTTQVIRRPPPPPGMWDIPQELYARIVDQITKDHRRCPKMSAAGNGQSKFEHWFPCALTKQKEDAVSRVLLRLFLGHLPQECQDLGLSACLGGITKKNGGVRILGKGTAQRRKVGRAIAKVMKDDIKEACGPQQSAMHSDGSAHVHRVLSALVAARPGVAVGSADVQDAFPSTLRDKALEKVKKHCPALYPLVYHLYKKESRHTIESEPGEPLGETTQFHGFDQGCNMSMGCFCITTRDALAQTQDDMRKQAAEMWARCGARVLAERAAAREGGGGSTRRRSPVGCDEGL